MIRRWEMAFWALLSGAVIVGCQVCEPGTIKACSYENCYQETGEQVCAPDGRGWLECECSMTAEVAERMNNVLRKMEEENEERWKEINAEPTGPHDTEPTAEQVQRLKDLETFEAGQAP